MEGQSWSGSFPSSFLTIPHHHANRLHTPFASSRPHLRILLLTQPTVFPIQYKTASQWCSWRRHTSVPAGWVSAHYVQNHNRSSDPARIWTCHWPSQYYCGLTTGLHLQAPYRTLNDTTHHQESLDIASRCPTLKLQLPGHNPAYTRHPTDIYRVTDFCVAGITLRLLFLFFFIFFSFLRKPILSLSCMVKAVWANTADSWSSRPDIYRDSCLPFGPSSHRLKESLWLLRLIGLLLGVRKD